MSGEPNKPAKKNLTVRIDDELREKLQLIADREMRPLANQITYFVSLGVEEYFAKNRLSYNPVSGQLDDLDDIL